MNDDDIVNFVRPYTSVSEERIRNVLFLVERVLNENIPGDLVEVGVWKGGILMAMALKCKQMGKVRTIHAYDTFTGMTPPTQHDVDKDGQVAAEILEDVKCLSSIDETQTNVARVDYSHVEYHIGDICNITSFPTIALLRLDTDWYESTKHELTYMEPCVSPFGFIIVDDYGHWNGCRRAVDEFGPPVKNMIDYTGIWWQRDFGRSILEAAVRDHPESEPARVLLDNFHHFVGLYTALGGEFQNGWGSYMFNGQRYQYQRETLKKQEHLFRVGQKSECVLEVGVYVGHSLLILLLSNPNLRITCVDCEDRFARRAVDYLNEHFGRRITFLCGRAEDVLPRTELRIFDCVHIDADHNDDAVRRQFQITRKLATKDAFFVFDDYEAVRSVVDDWISRGILEHVSTPGCLWTNCITRLKSVSS